MSEKEEYKPYASKMRQDLYRKLKLLSAAEDKPIQNIIEEAVSDYLQRRQFTEEQSSVREPTASYGARYKIAFDVPKEKEKKIKK